jgi:hypothetical protein
MIANRFNNQTFPQETGRIGNFRRNRPRFNKSRKFKFRTRQRTESSSDSDDNSPIDGNGKVPLEGIELLLNRDKVPSDFGKKMDKQNVDEKFRDKEQKLDPVDDI